MLLYIRNHIVVKINETKTSLRKKKISKLTK